MVSSYAGQGYGQVGGNVYGAAPVQSGSNTISQQNTEFLSSILSFLSKQQDPRLVASGLRNPQAPSYYANPLPVPQPVPLAPTQTQIPTNTPSQLPSQIITILQQLLNPNSFNASASCVELQTPASKSDVKTTSKTDVPTYGARRELKLKAGQSTEVSQSKVSTRPTASTSINSPPGTLSLQDIQRIREKKERLKAQKNAEQEASRREAASMRDELNKSISRKLKKSSNKNSKSTKRKRSASPESTTSTNSGETTSSGKVKVSEANVKEPTKPLFSLDQPASTQVLCDVAVALADSKVGISSASSTRPTGVVTPTPRPIHPVFMQSMNSFPLTEVTSSHIGTTTSTSVSVVPSSTPTQILSEIDSTLSHLRSGMQSSGNESEMRDTTAKLLRILQHLHLQLGASDTSSSGTAGQFSSSHADVLSNQSPSVSTTNSRIPEQQNLPNNVDSHRDVEVGPSLLHGIDPRTSSSVQTTLSETIDSHVAAFKWTLQHFNDSKLESASSVCVFEDPVETDQLLSGIVAEERNKIVQEYIERSSEPQPVPPPEPQQPAQNIDDILKKLKPFIQDLNKSNILGSTEQQTSKPLQTGPMPPDPVSVPRQQSAAEDRSMEVPPENHQPPPVLSNSKHIEQHDNLEQTSVGDQSLNNQPPYSMSCQYDSKREHFADIHLQFYSSPTPNNSVTDSENKHQFKPVPNQQLNIASSQQPVLNKPIVIPRPLDNVASQPDIIVPSHPVNVIAGPPPSQQTNNQPQHQAAPSVPVHEVLNNDNTLRPSMHQRFAATSPSSRSDSGTPTLDERYPDPVRLRKRKRRGDVSASQTNSFLVFDPENSEECEAIRSYLASVTGIQFDTNKMSEDLHSNINKKTQEGNAQSIVVQEEIRKVLPPGILWAVIRTADLKHLHSLPHLTLLKSAGTHVQFVSADSVGDVKARHYRNILTGDGGILVPLCPKTLLRKPAIFQNLMQWLFGQTAGVGKDKKWKIVSHQHLLNALQDAEKSEDVIERQNADQALDSLWLAGQKKLALELVKHQCDETPPIDKKAAFVWNWFDTATKEELAAKALTCSLKLQSYRLRQSRHVILLIDDDPLDPCWKPVWQSGICVSTMEMFVDLVCSKPCDPVTGQSTSCVLPLYSLAHKFL